MDKQAAKLERRRRQCRMSQRRYRDKQGSEEYNLVLDVNELRQRVDQLSSTRDLLRSRIWSSRQALSGAAAKAAHQYYIMFSRGLHDPESGGDCVRKGFEIQKSFLRAFFDPEVNFGGVVGVDAVLEQWRRYSQFHATIRVQYLSSEVLGPSEAPVVVVRGLLDVRLSRCTIEQLFPHVLTNEPLVQELIGKRVIYPTQTSYAFNERIQVVCQDLSVDFLEGLNGLLHDSMTASRVLMQSRIADSSTIKLDDCDSSYAQDFSTSETDRSYGSDDVSVEDGESQSPTPSTRLHLSYIMS